MPSAKTQKIIDSAHRLFWKHGIKRITVEEVCKDAGCSKMTFYRNFKDKNDVAAAVLDRIAEDGRQKYRALMARDIPFYQKLQEAVLMKAEANKGISEEFLNDLVKEKEGELAQKFTEWQKRLQKETKEDFRKAQKEGELRPDLNLDFALAISDKLREMAADPHLKSFFNNSEELITEVTRLFFFGIGIQQQDE